MRSDAENQVTTPTSESRIEPLFNSKRASLNFDTASNEAQDIKFRIDEISLVDEKLDQSEEIDNLPISDGFFKNA